MTTHKLQQTSCLRLYKKKLLPLILPLLLLIMMMMTITCVSAKSDIEKSSSATSLFHLRGGQHSNNNHHTEIDDITSSRLHHEYQQPLQQQDQQHRGTKEAIDVSSSSNTNNSTTLLLTQPLTFQVIITTLLTLLIFLQLLLLVTFFHQRSKRVLEFAQPIVICIFITCSIITTSSCYFYLYLTSITCAIREPIAFVFVSCMGATVGGRAWRISTLLNNPLLTAGRGGVGGGNGSSSVPRVERARQLTLHILSVLSGCEYSVVGLWKDGRGNASGGAGRGGRPIRVQITFLQMMRATLFMILPQLIWQVVVLSVPMLRSSRELASYTFVAGGGMKNAVTMEQYQCQSSVGFWPNYVSILLTLFPYAIAYLLNVRPKSELDQLPEMINERDHLKHSFSIFVRVLVVALPMIGLTLKNNPSAKAYGAICAVLGLPLACCYHIAYDKLNSTKSNITKQQGMSSSRSAAASSVLNDDANGRSNAALAVRMAEMYSRIGRVEETVQLVDETLGVFRKGNSGNHLGNLGGLQGDGRQEVASGFTVNDLKALEGDELQMIIQLLRLKGNALIKLKGPAGFAMSAKLNIDALKIFENCPAANKMKDISLMFPIYNMVGIQLKGGVIDQDDECSLEMDLAERFCHEAQLQAYHYARALANLAEMYGRVGMLDEAFKYFHIMKAVYMTKDHPKLLLEGYAVDRCAVNFASSALWYLQKGEIDNAIERCDYVIDHILPHYDEKDFIGLYTIFIQLIRVLKWNGQVEKARLAYHTYISDSVESHFAVGSIHKPMGLLLRICEGSSHEYNMDHIPGDVELALSFDMTDMTDNNFTCDGWSMKSMAAELCMHLARRLDAGNAARESLIDRGIMMATVAQQRVKASNGMVKHILAYEANKEIHKELLHLADEEVGVDRNVIYDASNSKRASDPRRSMTCDLKSSMKSAASLAFANRFNVKDDTSKTNGSTNNSNGSGARLTVSPTPAHVSVAAKKKVAFSQLSSSHLSSFGSGSNGSTSKHSSHHSHESINEIYSDPSPESSHSCESAVDSQKMSKPQRIEGSTSVLQLN